MRIKLVGLAGAAVVASLAVIPIAGAAGPHRCTGSDSGTYGDVVVIAGDVCTFSGTAKNLRVEAGGTLTLNAAHIGHDLNASKAQSVTINAGTQIAHDLHVSRTVGSVSVNGATVGHDAGLSQNQAVSVSGSTIGHDVHLTGNASSTLGTDHVGHDAHCAGPVSGSGNSYGHNNKGCP